MVIMIIMIMTIKDNENNKMKKKIIIKYCFNASNNISSNS